MSGLTGYRQITAAHLLALAIRHDGQLVTFDGGVAGLHPSGERVVVLQTI